jgi:hypothetical protein
MSATRPSLLGACLAALLSSSVLLADPGNGKNKQGNGNADSSQSSNSTAQKNLKTGNSGYSNDQDDEYFQRRYDDDLDRILRIFSEHRGQYGQIDALPPGIRKNLARGKPLPPGIAKKLNPDFARQLPNYQGYEWRQVGTDAALIDISTGVIREIMRDVLR